MITVLLFSSQAMEVSRLQDDLHYLTATRTDEHLEFIIGTPGKKEQILSGEVSDLSMALIEVNTDQGLDLAMQVRSRWSDTQILIIADVSVSPMNYLVPAIRPSALLLRPYDGARYHQVLKDFFILAAGPLFERNNGYYWAKTRDGTEKISYRTIYYIEAREKKLFIRTGSVEYGTGGTIEKMMDNLPDNFRRCHRSYIINCDYIDRIRLSEGYIYLTGAMEIPLSRKYREDFKGWMNGWAV